MAAYQVLEVQRIPSGAIVRLPDPASLLGADWRKELDTFSQELLDFIANERPSILCLDFEAISQYPSAGEAGIIRCQFLRHDVFPKAARLAIGHRGKVRLVGLSDDIKEVFALWHYDMLFEME